ncbi:hypothetical protein [uncultured Cellulomonas sp.]|uniref:hypothetical protein n=1 Tax=uncultured Cellulomonas sp. TaxID=189682 RepID=UPI0028E74214|nr:hypothetical protein [uncultured Cellulomonas sp.]
MASTVVQLQIYQNGAWRDFGASVASASTQPNLNISDSAGKAEGCWEYRGKIARSAFHVNWDDTTKTGSSITLCR